MALTHDVIALEKQKFLHTERANITHHICTVYSTHLVIGIFCYHCKRLTGVANRAHGLHLRVRISNKFAEFAGLRILLLHTF